MMMKKLQILLVMVFLAQVLAGCGARRKLKREVRKIPRTVLETFRTRTGVEDGRSISSLREVRAYTFPELKDEWRHPSSSLNLKEERMLWSGKVVNGRPDGSGYAFRMDGCGDFLYLKTTYRDGVPIGDYTLGRYHVSNKISEVQAGVQTAQLETYPVKEGMDGHSLVRRKDRWGLYNREGKDVLVLAMEQGDSTYFTRLIAAHPELVEHIQIDNIPGSISYFRHALGVNRAIHDTLAKMVARGITFNQGTALNQKYFKNYRLTFPEGEEFIKDSWDDHLVASISSYEDARRFLAEYPDRYDQVEECFRDLARGDLWYVKSFGRYSELALKYPELKEMVADSMYQFYRRDCKRLQDELRELKKRMVEGKPFLDKNFAQEAERYVWKLDEATRNDLEYSYRYVEFENPFAFIDYFEETYKDYDPDKARQTIEETFPYSLRKDYIELSKVWNAGYARALHFIGSRPIYADVKYIHSIMFFHYLAKCDSIMQANPQMEKFCRATKEKVRQLRQGLNAHYEKEHQEYLVAYRYYQEEKAREEAERAEREARWGEERSTTPSRMTRQEILAQVESRSEVREAECEGAMKYDVRLKNGRVITIYIVEDGKYADGCSRVIVALYTTYDTEWKAIAAMFEGEVVK